MGWMDSVNGVLDVRGMSIEHERVVVCDRYKKRAAVNAYMRCSLNGSLLHI